MRNYPQRNPNKGENFKKKNRTPRPNVYITQVQKRRLRKGMQRFLKLKLKCPTYYKDGHPQTQEHRAYPCMHTPSPEETTLTEETTAAAYGRLSRTPRAADGRGDPAFPWEQCAWRPQSKALNTQRERIHTSAFRSEAKESLNYGKKGPFHI